MNDLDDSTFRFYTSSEDINEVENYRSNLRKFDHDEFLLQSTARQSGYVVNSYIHGRASSEYSCSSGSIKDLISSGDHTCFEQSLSPVNHIEPTISEVSTIPSARSIIEVNRRGRSPSLSYTITSFQAQRGNNLIERKVLSNQIKSSHNLISLNDRNPVSVLSRKSIDLNPPCLSEEDFNRNKLVNYHLINQKNSKTARSSLCTFFGLCNCFGPRVKDVDSL